MAEKNGGFTALTTGSAHPPSTVLCLQKFKAWSLKTWNFNSKLTPPKTNMFPENQWLEDVFSYWNSGFLGDMLIFRGVYSPHEETNRILFRVPGWWFTSSSLRFPNLPKRISLGFPNGTPPPLEQTPPGPEKEPYKSRKERIIFQPLFFLGEIR